MHVPQDISALQVRPSFAELVILEQLVHYSVLQVVQIVSLESIQHLLRQHVLNATLALTVLFQPALPATTAPVIITRRQAPHHASFVSVNTTIASLARVSCAP